MLCMLLDFIEVTGRRAFLRINALTYQDEEDVIVVKIAIIDSGVYKEHPTLQKIAFDGIAVSSVGGAIRFEDDFSDTIGHGTAVTGILCKAQLDAMYFIIKVFISEDMTVEPDVLLGALHYIDENVECDLILMSLGTPVLDDPSALITVCEKLTRKGIQIISAFDNAGCLSYPACLTNVIGVDSANNLRANDQFEVIMGDGVVDLRAKGGLQRVCWVNPLYRMVTGTSFAAAHALVLIVQAYEQGAKNKKSILERLRIRAHNTLCFPSPAVSQNTVPIAINPVKAAVYPFNKEVHALLRFSEHLSFSITHICDEPLHGNVGADVDKMLFGEAKNLRIIEKLQNLWTCEDYDTLIIGHLDELSLLSGKDLLKLSLSACLEHKKNVYAFDSLSQYNEICQKAAQNGLSFYSPVCNTKKPLGRLGRLWLSSKPIVGVFGTSSRQGKFTLQLLLRYALQKRGYRIAQLGTEPTALLFQMEKIYPMGYGAQLPARNEEAVMLLNETIHDLEMNDPDLIIVGGQSCTIPYCVNHIFDLTFTQWEYLIGTNPDLFILCVNPQDSYDYIRRTIGFLENAGQGRVAALVLYPVQLAQEWYGFSFRTQKLNHEEYAKKCDALQKQFSLPVYQLNTEQIDLLSETIIDELSPDDAQ